MNCCSPTNHEPEIIPLIQRGGCPVCGHQGKKIDTATVKAMIAVSLREISDTPYFFCREATCDVVYFNETGTFTTAEIRERVFQKEPDSEDVFICYCFRHTRATIWAEFLETGQSTVIEDVNAGIQEGQCACDWRNPQGSCCLGNVQAVVRQIQAELRAVEK